MTERSVTHATFVIERTYNAEPTRVFNAFADPAAKARWFAGPDDWQTLGGHMDFRVGGDEIHRTRQPGGPVHTYRARYQDIVTNERIITTYEMYMDEVRSSVSVATVELEPAGDATNLRYTEQGAFLDGSDSLASREQGSRDLLEALAGALEAETAAVSHAGTRTT